MTWRKNKAMNQIVARKWILIAMNKIYNIREHLRVAY